MAAAAGNAIKSFLKTSRSAQTTCAITKALMAATAPFGVKYVTFFEFKQIGRFLTPINSFGIVPNGFEHHYLKEAVYRIDPFLKRSSVDLTPFAWHEFRQEQPNNQEIVDFINRCKSYDMLDGYVVPTHSPTGTMGMVSYMGPLSLDFQSYAQLSQLALYYSAAIRRVYEASFPTMPEVALTPRQLECVKWIALGKSDWEVASILGLSEATINRHVELAKERLGVRTRMQVVVEAFRTGQLNFDETQPVSNAG
jgi:DNA-binding CsgD family transcriptional regulator